MKAIAQGSPVALVSEAGCPSISDPGTTLVKQAHEEGLPVFCIPGPSSVTGALSVSGFSGDRFVFEGFLPKQQGKRKKVLQELNQQDRTIVFFEVWNVFC